MISDVHHPHQRPRPLQPGFGPGASDTQATTGDGGLTWACKGLHKPGSDTGSRAMSRRGLTADEQRGQTRVRTSTVDQQDALAPDPSLPAKALDRSACTVVLWAGEKWLAKGPCPCDWAEVERDQEGMSRDRRQGKLQAGNLGSPCWLAGCPQSGSLPESVCGRSVAVSPSLGAARCQAGGSESGQLQLQGTLRSHPHVCERLQ